jgi:hypothetical protein
MSTQAGNDRSAVTRVTRRTSSGQNRLPNVNATFSSVPIRSLSIARRWAVGRPGEKTIAPVRNTPSGAVITTASARYADARVDTITPPGSSSIATTLAPVRMSTPSAR